MRPAGGAYHGRERNINDFGQRSLRLAGSLVLACGLLLSSAVASNAFKLDMNFEAARIDQDHQRRALGSDRFDGDIVQGSTRLTLDAKGTPPSDSDIVPIASQGCASGEGMIVYSLRRPSPGFDRSTQKVMHRLNAKLGMQEAGEPRRTSFEAIFPSKATLDGPVAGSRYIFLQIWQGAPFTPPLALSISRTDASSVWVTLDVNRQDHHRERLRLAEIELDRRVCYRFTLDVAPQTRGVRSPVTMKVERARRAGGRAVVSTAYSGRWDVRVGYDQRNPMKFFKNRCRRRPDHPCCRFDGRVCRPNLRFLTTFGLYRKAQSVPASIVIGDIRQESL